MIETKIPINCPLYEYPDSASVPSTPIVNMKSHTESEEPLDDSLEEEETDTTHIEQKDSDFRTDGFITLSSSQTETRGKHFVEKPIDNNEFWIDHQIN